MVEDIPAWLSVPLIVVLSLTALYKCYILPNYVADNEATAENEKDKDNG